MLELWLKSFAGGAGAFFSLLAWMMYRAELLPRITHDKIVQELQDELGRERGNSAKWEQRCWEAVTQAKKATELVKGAVEVAEKAVP